MSPSPVSPTLLSEVDLREGAAALGVCLSPTQCQQLLDYGALILKWSRIYNLTALHDPTQVLTHHLLDSLAVLPGLQRQWPGAGRLLDVGSGAGLPGVVIAIVRPDLIVVCLDAVAKKVAFIRQAALQLALPNLRGEHARVENLKGQYELISSRAFATLDDFFSSSRHLLVPNGLWMAMKGKVPTEELARVPVDVDTFHVEQLQVPEAIGARCVVWARPCGRPVKISANTQVC
ncbi:MAG: 16S rRNA (guanine(527)-N(7))-methyltransferase RsmG [Burkholderiaceae bacterium]|jgi:16S rRNA (guanine527-N7)-methyltransferase|nr:16S rRNA (guanine(527)-N(7))-methyltransferase RsmG [Burkholderiaceae bacterium]